MRFIHRLLVVCAVLTSLLAARSPARGADELQRLPETLELRLQSLEEEVRRLREESAAVSAREARYVADAESPHDQFANWETLGPPPGAPCDVPCDPAPPKYPTVKVTGFFHLDSVWFDQDPLNRATLNASNPGQGDLQDGMDFRRARLAATGNVDDWVSYMVEFDFATSQPLFTDVWMNFSQLPILGNVRVGRFRQPFGMTELTSIRELPFLERPTLFCMSPFRQTGIGFYNHSCNERMTWAASAFRYPSDNFGNNAGDNGGWGGAARFTCLPYYECDGERLVHLGFGAWYADPSHDETRFANTPEIQVIDRAGGLLPAANFVVPFFVDTGVVPTQQVSSTNVELAGALGRVYFQSEWRWLTIDQIGGPTRNVEGAYAECRYVLTGEKLPYNTATGVFGRIVPDCPVHPCGGGIGAWEVAARWSWIDLNGPWLAVPPANPGPGRELTNVTLGANWYWNRYTKFQFNYIHAMLDDPAFGRSDADIWAVRGQIDF
ncbi:MAG: porin [Planctomycetales bacterium]|nr:porin [Planctomycetales bacterium]